MNNLDQTDISTPMVDEKTSLLAGIPHITGKRIVYSGKHLRMVELDLLHPDGSTSVYEMTERISEKVFGIVSVLPITQKNEVILLKQFRAPLDTIIIELPAGCAEVGKHDSLLDAVNQELREEAGYASDEVQLLGEFPSSAGMTNELISGYIATNCRKVSSTLDLDADEYIQVITIPFPRIGEFLMECQSHGVLIDWKVFAFLEIYQLLSLENAKK